MTKLHCEKSNGLVAFAALAGLLLQMAWATAHYPMLLASLGTTQSGVAMRTMVLCLHRAKEQGIFDKLNQSQTNQSPINRTSDDEQAPPADNLCTFSIALTGNDIGASSDIYAVPAPKATGQDANFLRNEQMAKTRSYLASLGRAPPA